MRLCVHCAWTLEMHSPRRQDCVNPDTGEKIGGQFLESSESPTPQDYYRIESARRRQRTRAWEADQKQIDEAKKVLAEETERMSQRGNTATRRARMKSIDTRSNAPAGSIYLGPKG